MSRIVAAVVALAAMFIPTMIRADDNAAADEPIVIASGDWPWWRGPSRNGVAEPGQNPPLKWSDDQNLLWQAAVPGRGHGSPTIVGNQVLLAAADHERGRQLVLSFDLRSGERLWEAVVHEGQLETKGHNNKSSLASASVASDGHRLYINFLHDGAVYTTALSLAGERIWQTKITDFIVHQGFASSPALYQSLVLVSADNKGSGLLAGLDRRTGSIVWKRERPQLPNYTSPIVLQAAGRDQLLLTGCDLVTSLDPLTGNKIWEIPGATTECVTSTVTDGKHIFTSGGYPKNHLAAVRADGSGKIDWENGSRVYVPSLLVRDGHLYGVLDAGVASCWNCDTGAEVWKHRLGGTFSASPVLVGDKVFCVNEAGTAFVFKADPAGFELLAENQLGDDVFASPSICGSRIYQRIARIVEGSRQEFLCCIGHAE